VLLTACGTGTESPAAGDDAIRFASYDFQENQILVELYAEGVRRAGLPVSVDHGTGTREVVLPALEQGVVDVVADYLGTALVFTLPPGADLPAEPKEMKSLLDDAMNDRGVVALQPARAED